MRSTDYERYVGAATALADLPGRLERERSAAESRAKAEQERAARDLSEREARLATIGARIDQALRDARSLPVQIPGDAALAGRHRDGAAGGADPIAFADQLAQRLASAVEELRHISAAVTAEEARLADERRRRHAEEQERLERLARERDEAWARARRGDRNLALGLAGATVLAGLVGLAAGFAALGVVVIAAGAAAAVVARSETGVPARVRARRGDEVADPRETGAERGAGARAAGGAGAAVTGLAGALGAAVGATPIAAAVAAALALAGAAVLVTSIKSKPSRKPTDA